MNQSPLPAMHDAALLAAIVESSDDAIVSKTLAGVITSWNPAAERLFGYGAGEAIGAHFTLLLPPDRVEEESLILERVRRGERIETFETTRRHSSGRLLDVSVTISPVHDEHGRLAGVSKIVRDIGQRKRAEEERRALEAQLRQAQQMEAIGTLAAGVAHDFNTLLGSMLGNVVLAQADATMAASTREALQQIEKAGLRARDLVRQILAFSHRQPRTLSNQLLRPLVEEAVRLLHATLPAGVEIDAALSDEPLHALVDATQVQQVVMNLCTNAWHALSGGSGRIEVGLGKVHLDADAGLRHGGLPAGDYAHLWVADNGCGMDAATQARVFEPFFTTKPAGQGTGLGLSVVHGIVTAHHGAVAVRSAPGAGTTFDVHLPLAASDDATPAPAPTVDWLLRDGGHHVLYIDDDDVMVAMVERLLQRLDYRVTCHQDPRAAVAEVRAQPQRFDLVVTDLNMPEFSGLQVAAALARIRPELPVIISSGYLSEEMRSEATRLGVRRFVRKENTVEELGRALHEVLARPPGR